MCGRKGCDGEKETELTNVPRFDLLSIDAGLKHMETTCRLHYFYQVAVVCYDRSSLC